MKSDTESHAVCRVGGCVCRGQIRGGHAWTAGHVSWNPAARRTMRSALSERSTRSIASIVRRAVIEIGPTRTTGWTRSASTTTATSNRVSRPSRLTVARSSPPGRTYATSSRSRRCARGPAEDGDGEVHGAAPQRHPGRRPAWIPNRSQVRSLTEPSSTRRLIVTTR